MPRRPRMPRCRVPLGSDAMSGCRGRKHADKRSCFNLIPIRVFVDEKNLHYGDCGVIDPGPGIGNWSWKTGEVIATAAGGVILTRVILAVAAAAGIMAGAGVTARRRRVLASRGLRSSRRDLRFRR